jgi:hypothetical protein
VRRIRQKSGRQNFGAAVQRHEAAQALAAALGHAAQLGHQIHIDLRDHGLKAHGPLASAGPVDATSSKQTGVSDHAVLDAVLGLTAINLATFKGRSGPQGVDAREHALSPKRGFSLDPLRRTVNPDKRTPTPALALR